MPERIRMPASPSAACTSSSGSAPERIGSSASCTAFRPVARTLATSSSTLRGRSDHVQTASRGRSSPPSSATARSGPCTTTSFSPFKACLRLGSSRPPHRLQPLEVPAQHLPARPQVLHDQRQLRIGIARGHLLPFLAEGAPDPRDLLARAIRQLHVHPPPVPLVPDPPHVARPFQPVDQRRGRAGGQPRLARQLRRRHG